MLFLRLFFLTFSFILLTGLCIDASAGGTISGFVTYDGPLPARKLIHMDADPVCYAVNHGNAYSQSVMVGDNKALADVFVYIKSGLAQTSYPPPAIDALVSQGGCNYSPHVLGVMVGQKVKFLNPDGTLHNVHAMCKINPEFNASMPDFRKEMEVTFDKAEAMFPLRCDVHPWMKAWIMVLPHPFFAVTGADGKFEIKNVPPGSYVVEAWHEKLQDQSATVTVADHSTQKQDFTFSTPK